MANIKLKLSIDTTRKELWRALTTQEGLSSWWTTGTVAKAELGHMNIFRFEKGFFVKFHVDEMSSIFSIRWTCHAGIEEWQGTVLEFRLVESDGPMALVLDHKNWKEETDYFASCTYHWAKFLDSLKGYLENGKGSPFPADK